MSSPTITRRLAGWLPPLAWATLIFLLSALPGNTFPAVSLLDELPSVAVHFVLYAVLMGLLERSLQRGTNLPATHATWLALTLIALYAISDEYHQTFVPGRLAEVSDLITDMAGATFAWLSIKLRPDHRP